MKPSLLNLFRLFCFLIVINCHAEPQESTCNCWKRLRGYHNWYKRAWVGMCTEKSHPHSYPYYLISKSIKSKMISDPTYYFEYYHNLHVFNESLVNYLNDQMNDAKVWPTVFGEQIEGKKLTTLAAIEHNYETDEYIRNQARKIYKLCTTSHRNRKTFYDYSFLEFVEGNVEIASELAEKYILTCKEQNCDEEVTASELIRLGESYNELAEFNKAIVVLSEAIHKDPSNKSAYFHRSAAYFETGNFEEALIDYQLSDKENSIPDFNFNISQEFSQNFLSALGNGVIDGGIEFAPSLCNSIYGLQKALWADATLKDYFFPGAYFAKSAYNSMQSFIECCKKIDQETIEGFTDELKTLYRNFNQLTDAQKGSLIGYTLGKFGVDIFAGAALAKGVHAFRTLKNANRICNMEAMALSKANKEAIVASSLAHAAERDAYLKRVKIHWDRQNKHIPGKHNFEPDKGILKLDPNEIEILIKQHVGTGERVIGEFGKAGYKERVDFGKIIGEYALKKEGKPVQYFPTSKGIITHAKDGSVHLWPSEPRQIFK